MTFSGAIQPRPQPQANSTAPKPTGELAADAVSNAPRNDQPKQPETPTYTYLLRLTIGERTFENTKGDFIGEPLVQLRTRQYSRALFTLNDPNGDVWKIIRESETQEAKVELGYPPDFLYTKITGNLYRIGRRFPIGVEVEVVDSSAQLNQTTGPSVDRPQAVETPETTDDDPEPPGETEQAIQGQPPTSEQVQAFAAGLNQAQRTGQQAQAESTLERDSITAQQLENSLAATGGVSQQSTVAADAAKAGLNFENRTPTAVGDDGDVSLAQPRLRAKTQKLQNQGDVVVTKGDGTVAQVAPGQGEKTDIVIDWEKHKASFHRLPVVTKKTPYQFPSSVTVQGWSMLDGQQIGATVVSPTQGNDQNATVQVPDLGEIKFSQPIYEGSKYTWGDAANNDTRRRPRSKQVAEQIIRIARVLAQLETQWNNGKKMQINSWYRPPEINNAVSSSGMTGPHTTGNAVDVWFTPSQLIKMHKWLDQNWDGGVAIHPAVHQGKGFVHVDLGARRRWTY